MLNSRTRPSWTGPQSHATYASGSRASWRCCRKSFWTLRTQNWRTCFCSVYPGSVMGSRPKSKVAFVKLAQLGPPWRAQLQWNNLRSVLKWVSSCNLDWVRVWCTAYNLGLFTRNCVSPCSHSTSTMFIALLTIYFPTLAFFRKLFLTSIYSLFNVLCSCDKPVCIGNWQQKNIPGSSPMTIQNIFDLRRIKFQKEPTK